MRAEMRMPVRARGGSGVTLIEMVLALTILALAGGIIYSSFSTAVGSWNAGFTHGKKDHVARISLDRMAQQLRSAVAATVTKSDREVVAFDSGEDYLRFVTLLPVGNGAPRQVSYSIEDSGNGKELVYREYPWPDKKFFEGGEPIREERLPEIAGLELTLMAGREEVREQDVPSVQEEQKEWLPGEVPDLPAEVGVLLTTASEGSRPGESFSVTITIPGRSR